LKELARRSIQSVLVEGGARVAGAFMDAGLVDKFSFFIAPLIIGGERAPGAVAGAGASMLSEATRLERTLVLRHGDDIEITGYPRRDQSNG
jgi:diaminohydroxyphosphoribosylaminopyrimidine deaminase/5-amino-6-(5-phosphoribosylamino)uracil reductase